MTTEDRSMIDEARIRTLVEQQATALRAKDVEGALRPYAPGIVQFDLAPPLQNVGPDVLDGKALASWFATWRGGLGYEVRELRITTCGDAAFCYGFVRISGTKTDGAPVDVWARLTLGLHKTDGAWKIVHEHMSVPFYMDGSLKAAVDLTPA